MSDQKPNVKKFAPMAGVTKTLDDWSDRLFGAFSDFLNNIEKMRDIAKNNYELGTLHLQNGNVSDAIFRFKIVTTLEPRNPDAWFFLGSSYMAERKMSLARKALEKAVELKPDYEEARYMLALAKGKQTPKNELPRRIPYDLAVSHFDSIAADYTQEQIDLMGYDGHTILCKMIRSELVPERVDYEIIELGVGTGLCGPLMRDVASRIIGVDISGEMLSEAMKVLDVEGQKIYDILMHKEMHAYMREVPEASCDIVMSAIALSFVGDLADIYQLAMRALRPGGIFAFSIDTMLGDDFQFDPTAGRFRYPEAYLKRLAVENGFTILQMEEAQAYPAYPMWFCVFAK